MKKYLLLLPLMCLMSSCVFFEMDNYEGPDASVTGNVIDAKTKENVPTECKFGNFFGGAYMGAPTEGYFSVYELESYVYKDPNDPSKNRVWDYKKAQYWHIKYDGSYANTMIFSGKYDIEATANNFYPTSKEGLEFKKGENTLDWEVVPYARVIDPKVELVNGMFEATFKCELGDASKANAIVDARLLCYSDAFVGIYCNYCQQDPNARSTKIVADGTTVNKLKIDPTLLVNNAEFKYSGKNHYFRIAVCAQGNGFNTAQHYNYSPTIIIKY